MRHKYFYITFIVLWFLLAIDPQFRDDWLLENLLVFILFPIIILFDKKFSFSTLSMYLIFSFSVLHIIGAHFTYAQMYYFNVVTEFFGFERNHFDRVVHFLFGLFISLPTYEIMRNYFSKNTSIYIVFLIITSIACIYEEIEWLVVELFYKELGIAFLGVQGDVWDAQKDIGLSIVGSIVTLALIKFTNTSLTKD